MVFEVGVAWDGNIWFAPIDAAVEEVIFIGEGVCTERTDSGEDDSDLIALTGVAGGSGSSSSGRFWATGDIGVGPSILEETLDFESKMLNSAQQYGMNLDVDLVVARVDG